jgi:hypothetical protein
MTAFSSLPPTVRSYVSDFVVRARRLAMWRAAGLALAVLLGWALACCLLDRVLQFPPVVRAVLLGAGLSAMALILAGPVRALLRRKVDWLEAAAEVERHNPRFAQRLLTVTTRLLGPVEHRGSDDMLYRLLSDVDREVATRRAARAIALGRVVLPWLAAGVFVAAAIALNRLNDLGLPRLALRFAAPLADVEPVTTTRLKVMPGDLSLVQSDPLRVEATVERLPEGGAVWLMWREEGGDWVRRLMSREAGGPKFGMTLPAVDRDLRYRVAGGDARSREHSVRVLRRPAVAGFHIRYAYPAYADRPPLSVTNTDGLIEAPAGTEATLTITATEPLQSALLRVGGEKVLMARGASDYVRTATFKVARSGPYELDLISTREVPGGGPPGAIVRALSDRKPLVRLMQAGDALRLNPRDILPLAYQALDDFGIESLVVRAQVNGGAVTEQPVPRDGDPRRCEGTFNFDLAGVPLVVGDVVVLSMAAKDRAGHQEVSETLQVLVAPRSVDLETHQRITELEAAAQLAGLVAEELDATVKALAESQAEKAKSADASAAAASRGNRFLTTATDTAVLVRQSILRAVVRGRSPELATALANLADSVQVITAGGAEVFRSNGMAGEENQVRENLSRLVERAGAIRDQLRTIAQGERAAAILADRENLAASEKRAADEPQSAERIRQTLLRAKEDVSAGVKGMGFDPAAPNLDDLLRAKVEAELAVLKAQQPIDFAAAAREWSQEIQRAPLRRLLLEDRLALAAQAEAVRPAADLVRARDLQLCGRAASRIASDAASDKYAGRPASPGAPNQFASAVAALQREHEINRRPADVRPPDEVKVARQAAGEARRLVAQWAGELLADAGAASPAGPDGRARYRRAEETAVRGSADLAGRDYPSARAADRELLRQLADGASPAAAPDRPAGTQPGGGAAAQGPPVPAYLRRDLERVEHLTDRAETIDQVQSEQDRLAQETKTVDAAAPQAPLLADRQIDVASRIAEVSAHDAPGAPAGPGGGASGFLDKMDDPNWRGRATAAVVKAQEQLAAMPQHLTAAREEAAALKQAAERVEMAKREAAAAPADRRSALERAARQAEDERKDAEKRLRNTALPVIPAAAAALARRLAPFEPESAAAREVVGRRLASALQDFDQAAATGDAPGADRAAAAARDAIDAAQKELARAQDEFTERDPLVAAKWFARAAADSLTRSPPDFQSAYRRQMDTSQALSRAWDRTVHEAAAQRMSLVPSMQSLYGVPMPAPILAGKRGGDAQGAASVSDLAAIREWGRLRPREVEELNAPLRETEAPGYEKALQLYFESLSRTSAEQKR